MRKITVLPVMGDNYIFICNYSQHHCFIVDPGQARPVIEMLEQNKVLPTHILVTHNHGDHTAGIGQLVKKYKCCVISAENPVEASDVKLARDNDISQLENMNIRIISTPGHTAKSVCYYIEPDDQNPGAIFTGDTMFIAGCGRVFGGSMDTMYNSLQKLAALPDDTLVYPGHDYTEENYRFALTIEPDNTAVRQALDGFRNDRTSAPHVPSTIAVENQTNVFIRARDEETFARLRKQKDFF